MKKFFTIPLCLVLGLFAFISLPNNSSTRQYNYKNIQKAKNIASANDAIEYNKSLYKDVVTNQVETRKLAAARDEVIQRMMIKSTNLSFIEEGPDNVGGRTRAIAMHPDDSDVMYAGSVSGGLFKTVNGGSTWTRVQEFDDAMENSATGTGSLGISSLAFSGSNNLYISL